MRFNHKPQRLKSLKPLQGLDKNKRGTKSKYLDELELLVYSTNLCFYSMRILRNEIKVNNRAETLSLVNNEVFKLNNLLSKRDYFSRSEYTKKNTKEFFKKVGLKPRHIKN
jgi:hypothetical protein